MGSEHAPCVDCGTATGPPRRLGPSEWYMVTNEVWGQAGMTVVEVWGQPPVMPPKVEPLDEFLCIGCLEKRIGRRLTPADFIDAPINEPNPRHSARLLSRLGAEQD